MNRFALLFLLLVSTVLAQDASKARAAFDKADRGLNEAWAAVKKALPTTEVTALTADQRSWVAYRDHLARSPMFTGADGRDEFSLDSAPYLEAAADLTKTRTEWLWGWIRYKDDDTLTGIWEDSYGGQVEIVQKDNQLHFSLTAVRGPTSHTGELSGIAKWNRPLGWFSDLATEPGKDGGETNLAFVLRGQALEIIGANTGFYHGARAYFDGRYIKIAHLDSKAQAKLLKGTAVRER
ncbi:MAG TPA: lysozyme inhibitor LprI family protein [Prosthecobacter sp.]|nr:lysozyme inhibitor LprI family protein [Prosthecobacter sp.]